MEEDYFASSRNGHQLVDFYDKEANTLDIRSNGMYPSNVLSNLCSNGFRFEGVLCGSMEGFLQGLKQQDVSKQRQICSMKGGNARKRSVASWQTDQIIWWKGQPIDRQSSEYQALLRRAYQAMFDQNERFRAALMATRGMTLLHTTGNNDPFRTIITETELCAILTELREAYDKRDKSLPVPRKRVFVGFDNMLDKPEGTTEALRVLQQHFDVYILLMAPCEEESASFCEMEKVVYQLDDTLRKRLIITTCANILRGDYLIDENSGNGTSKYEGEFEGECIGLGSDNFPDWSSVINHLLLENRVTEE